MKSKLLLLAVFLMAATISVSARYTIITDTNHVTTVSFTNSFYEGVCTVEGRDDYRWVPLQNFFTTQRVGQVQMKLPTNYSRFRLVTLAIGPGNTFSRLGMAYGSLHTIAGGGASEWSEGANATNISFSDARYATADEAGNIYVVDRGAHAVDRISPDGKINTFVGKRQPGSSGDFPDQIATNYPLDRPSAIYYTRSNLYILDAGNRRIVEARYKSALTNYVVNLVQYDLTASGVATNAAGLWVRVPVLDGDLFEAYFGNGTELKRLNKNVISVHATGFSDISFVTLDPQGRTIVCDPPDNRVYRVRGSGNKEPVAGNGFVNPRIRPYGAAKKVSLPGASSVWYLPTGGYLISLDSGARIWCVDANDQASPFVYGAAGVNAGDGEWFRAHSPQPKISNVRSVALAPNGDMIILQTDGIIRKIDFLRHVP